MSEVFLATQVQLDCPVVVKVLKTLSDEPARQSAFVDQFRAEAQLLARLSHPYLGRVIDLFEEDGQPHLVMEYIEGRTLHEVVEAAPRFLRLQKVLEWAEQILDALEYLHRQDPPIVVRDLKPQNILLASSDWRIRLIDFGLARPLTPDTRTEAVLRGMGSLGFAPLEQYGRGSTDHRTDLYSFGATLLFLLTGQVPVPAHARVAGTPLVDPRTVNPTVTEPTWLALQRLMHLYPERRPGSTDEARELLGLRAPRESRPPASAPEVGAAAPRQAPSVTCVRLREPDLLPLAFSPTGRMMVSASKKGTVRLWEVSTGREMRRFQGNQAEVLCLAFSPDEKLLASGSEDGTVVLWDMASRRQLLTLRAGVDRAWVRTLAFSKCGRLLASGGADSVVRVWEVPCGRRVATLRGHDLSVISLAFFPSSRLLASGSWDDTIRLWYVPEGTEAACLRGHSLSVTALAVSPDGTRLASGSSDTTVRLWDVSARSEVERFQGHDQAVTSLAFSPDGSRLVSSSWDGTVQVWDLRVRGRTTSLEGHSAPVTAVGVSPSGRLILSGSKDSTLRLWRT